jgi:hypothetical protein
VIDISSWLDLFGATVLGLLLAGASAPNWAGWVAVLAFLIGLIALTWVTAVWMEQRRADRAEQAVEDAAGEVAEDAVNTVTFTRALPLPAPRRPHSASRRHPVPAHPVDQTQVIEPVRVRAARSVEDVTETAVPHLHQPRVRGRRRAG